MATSPNLYKDLYYKKTAGATDENSFGFESQLLIVRCRNKNFNLCNETCFLISQQHYREHCMGNLCLVAHAQWAK